MQVLAGDKHRRAGKQVQHMSLFQKISFAGRGPFCSSAENLQKYLSYKQISILQFIIVNDEKWTYHKIFPSFDCYVEYKINRDLESDKVETVKILEVAYPVRIGKMGGKDSQKHIRSEFLFMCSSLYCFT